MAAGALALATGAAEIPGSAAEPTLAVVLARTASYVAEFQRRLAGIVAEERYVQFARSRQLVYPNRIVLRSDLLLVKPRDTDQWVQFRDVFEVDGTLVRDRQDRLTHLFLEPSEAGQSQMMRILNESARYNIGSILRNVNTPLFALEFLDAAGQRRFRFKRSADPLPAAARGSPTPDVFRASTEVWVIEYSEHDRPTIIRSVTHADVPAHGRFWIEPATGRVLMSELATTAGGVRATIDVSFKSEPILDMLVPVEMREHYEGRRDRSIIDATASYGKFRQFQVNVDQTFLIKE